MIALTKNAADAPTVCEDDPGDRGTDGAGAHELHRVEPYCVDELVGLDELGDERLPRGDVHAGDEPGHEHDRRR